MSVNTLSTNNRKMNLRISPKELKRRQEAVLDFMKKQSLDAFLLFKPDSIFYLTGFAFVPTERPAALLQTADTAAVAFIPRLEIDHCRQAAVVDRIESYPEYPGETHPMVLLGDILTALGLAGSRIGVDSDGYGGRFGYTGPRLSEMMAEAKIIAHPQLIVKMRQFKSAEEFTHPANMK